MNIDKALALEVMQTSLDSLSRSGTIKQQLTAKADLVLMGGAGSEALDSLGFVTLIMDLEMRIEEMVGQEVAITLSDVGGFDINNPTLTAGLLAEHIVSITR